MPNEINPFNLLLGELSAVLDADCIARVNTVLSSWAGCKVRIPPAKSFIVRDAERAARRMLASGTPTDAARDRLMSMGVSRTTAYTIIRRARQAACDRQAAQAQEASSAGTP